ncbi:MFS transporter [Kitasatospora sp. NPDC090091]|uniref:MFS transporter n=1 Tax=Kitasatospora sp. NPDC090091 TaxID=3364081 RepID=UPI0037FCF585
MTQPPVAVRSSSADAVVTDHHRRTARPGYRWTVLGAATFAQVTSCFFVQGIGATGVQLRHDLDLSTAQLGLLLSAAQAVPLVGLLVAGELLDRYGERWIVGAGACVVAAGLLAGSAAPGYPALLSALVVVGAGYSTAQPGGSKSVAGWFDPSRRGLAMGIRQAGLPLGGALAAAVQPVLAEAFGWRATLLCGGLVALLGAAVFTGLYRPPPGRPAAASPAGRRADAPPAARAPAGRRLRERLRTVRDPAMARIMLSGTSLVAVQSGVLVLTVLHLHDTAGLGPGAAALVLVAAQGAGAVGRISLAAWSDRRTSGRYATVMACMAAATAATAALATPLGHSAVAACLLLVGLGFFGLGWYGPWVTYVAESAPPERTGFALGLAMAVNQVAVIAAPPVLGLLRDATHGFAPAWGLLAAFTAAALAVTARAERRRPTGV